MHIRTFRAANLNAALEMIRLQMGSEATVLHTRQVESGGLRFLRRAQVEVTAGLRHPAKQEEEQPQIFGDPVFQQIANLGLPNSKAQVWFENSLRRQNSIGQQNLVRQRRQADGETPEELLRNWLASQIPMAAPIDVSGGSRRVVALVGATGVGKTTTIAKLAGQFCMDKRSRVGLMTVDAFRAAAVDQIGAFAKALKIPLEVVRVANDVCPALERLSDVDLLLVDTMGQSPRGPRQLKHLAGLLGAIAPDETLLVLDANNSCMAAEDCLRAFSNFAPSGLILSKIDEVRSIAPVVAAVIGGTTGISYVTNGQSVPRDIERADCSALAKLASGLAMKGTESVISRPKKSA